MRLGTITKRGGTRNKGGFEMKKINADELIKHIELLIEIRTEMMADEPLDKHNTTVQLTFLRAYEGIIDEIKNMEDVQ